MAIEQRAGDSCRRPIRAVIFDMDGLLLDTEQIYTDVTQDIVGPYGHRFDWTVKQDTIGLGESALAERIISAFDLPMTAIDFLAQREPLLQSRFAAVPAKPGAERLVRHLAAHDIPIAVGTSSSRALLELKSGPHQDWFALFDVIVTADDKAVAEAKPAPDIFRVAARRIGCDPAETLVFEDSPFGIQAARAAGMSVIAVPDAAMDRTRFEEANDIIKSLHDFESTKWALPSLDV
ncbi:HAD-IA family hydrolase [Salinisphaera sp. SWV1]|uniref:HAD-IA family hydrolase n=1 Tax=Salinisphaera sp. SWV1 TaxID=3454139 RepID=UPI003F871467